MYRRQDKRHKSTTWSLRRGVLTWFVSRLWLRLWLVLSVLLFSLLLLLLLLLAEEK